MFFFFSQFTPGLDELYNLSLPGPTSKLEGYHVGLLAVLPSYQGKGIGRKLIGECIERVGFLKFVPSSKGLKGLLYI